MIHKIILYPGIIMHEFMHFLMCIILGVKVHGFKLGFQESHVKHSNTNTTFMFLISFSPFIVGNIIAIFLIYISLSFMDEFIIYLIYNWLIISIIYYSIPSEQDCKNTKNSLQNSLSKMQKNSLGYIFSFIGWIFIYLPLLAFISIIYILDKFEVMRVFLIIIIYTATYYFVIY